MEVRCPVRGSPDRADVRRVGSGRGSAPRRHDLASLESFRCDAGGAWREMEP